MSNIFDYFDDAISPIKRYPDIYQKHVKGGWDLMTGEAPWHHDLWRKPAGAALTALSPVSAAYEAVRHEPIRDALITAGMSPEKADQTAMYIGAALDVGVPVGMAMKGLNLPTEVANRIAQVGGAAEIGAGSAVMAGTKLAQKVAPQTDIVTPMAKRVGENRISMVDPALSNWINRRRGSLGPKIVGEKEQPAWYSHPLAKFMQAPQMVKTAIKGRGQVRGGTFNVLTPKVSEALDKTIKFIEDLPKNVRGGGGTPGAVDVYHGQIAYLLSILQKYEPFSARTQRFKDIVGKYVFPDNVSTTLHELSKKPEVVFNFLKKYWGPDMNPSLVEKHIAPFIAKDMGLKGHNVHLSTKPFYFGGRTIGKMEQEGAINDTTFGLFGAKGRLPYIPRVKEMVEEAVSKGGVASKEEIIDRLMSENKHIRNVFKEAQVKWKERRPPVTEKKAFAAWLFDRPKLRLYSKPKLNKAIVDDGNYISVSQQFTSADTLLATMPARMIISKSDPKTGAMIHYDQMKQGMGIRFMDFMLDVGSDINRIFIDIRPLYNTNKNLVENEVRHLIEQIPLRLKKVQGSKDKLSGEMKYGKVTTSNIHLPIQKRLDLARKGLNPEDVKKYELSPDAL
jgi:hypothetical protein